MNPPSAVILFDGVCTLCDAGVNFILSRDPKAYFRFASLQSEAGRKILKSLGLPAEAMDTMVLVEGDRFYLRSSAALHIARRLRGAWRLFSIFLAVPAPIRDFFYDIVAKNRYRWFGKKDSCLVPRPGVMEKFRERFLDDAD